MKNSLKSEKLLTQKESARLYLIELMNPSDEDLENWDLTYDLENPKKNKKGKNG